MQVTALTKQLALHSSYAKQDNVVTLTLLDSKEHLNTDSAIQQLQQALSEVLMQDISLQVILDTPNNTPFAVQQNINQVRLEHAKKVVETDQSFALLKESFTAQVQEDSIKPR
jgi:DNA polymerase-3 subunit gamma/tau